MSAPVITHGYTIIDDLKGATSYVATVHKSSVQPQTSGVNYNGWWVARSSVSRSPGERMGSRQVFSAPIDLTGGDYVCFQHGNSYGNDYKGASVIFLLFFDSSGNWAEWEIHSNNYERMLDVNRINLATSNAINWTRLIDRASTPDDSSGTLDWSSIAGIELFGAAASWYTGTNITAGIIGHLGTATLHSLVGGDAVDPGTFALVADAVTDSYPYTYEFYTTAPDFDGGNGETRCAMQGVRIGDGVTATRFEQSRAQLAFVPDHSVPDDYLSYHAFMGAGSNRTLLDVEQSAGCHTVIADSVYSGRGGDEYSVILLGHLSSASRLARNITCWRPWQVAARNWDLDGVIVDSPGDGLVVNAGTTTPNPCTVRNGRTGCRGLVIEGAPGDYSELDVRCSGNATHDLTIVPSASGTYDLRGVSAPDGYTLKVHNASATDAVTVQITPGITVSSSTAGGGITIDNSVSTPFVVRCVDQSGAPIEGARVRVEAGATGPLTQGDVVINALTDSTGTASTSLVLAGTQSLQNGWARKASASPMYREAPVQGEITGSGFSTTVTMVLDE